MAKSVKPQQIKVTKGQLRKQNVNPPGSNLNYFDYDKPAAVYILLGVILLAILFFFREGVFSGKLFASADNLSPLTFQTFLNDAKAQGIFPLWLPYIFMGMPSLASLTAAIPSAHNFYSFMWDKVFEAISGGSLFFLTLPYYFIFGITLFLYARFKFKNNLISLFCALLGVFATGIIQLIIVGHHTKMMTFAFFPLILLLFEKLMDSEDNNGFKMMFNFALLTVVFYIQLHFHHIQMLFYSYMMIGIYVAYYLVYNLINKINIKGILRTVALFIAGVILALAMDADVIMSIKDYSKYSMRGESSITAKAEGKTADKPLSYDYATNWSFSPGEVLTFVLPYYYGFGSVEVKGQRANLYWGQMPFTDSPVYFGVIVLVLAAIGAAFNFKKNPFIQATSFIILFFLFLSFGRTFPLIYDIFFNYVPFFGSFRAPVMIHYYIDLAFVILAGYGIWSIVTKIKEVSKSSTVPCHAELVSASKIEKTAYVLFAVGALMFLISLIGFESSYTEAVSTGPLLQKMKTQADPQQIAGYIKQISGFAYENVISDLRLHAFLILIVGALIYYYNKKKISGNLLILGIIIIGLFDLLSVTSKTLHWDDKGQKDSYFAEADYTKWLLAREPDTYKYRVAVFNRGSLVTSNELAYFRLHLFNGYQGAKIRIYQDAIDVSGGENPFLMGLANVKYVISDTPIKDTVSFREAFKGSNIIYENRFAMPRAFFVDECKVETGMNILNKIKTAGFNPYITAFVEKDLGKQIDKPDSSVYARITSFNIHNIEYEVNASGNNLLVLNEIYYPSGWKAYIDGTETEFYKTDYLLRSVIVPKGKHKIEFKFYPESYYTGKNISIAVNILVSLLLVGGIAGIYLKKKKT